MCSWLVLNSWFFSLCISSVVITGFCHYNCKFLKCSIWGSPLSCSNARQFSFFLPTSFRCWCSVSALAWSNLSCHSHQQNESNYIDFFSCILIPSWFPPPCSAFIYLYWIIHRSMRTTDSDCATDHHTKSSCFISDPTGMDDHGIAIICTVTKTKWWLQ